MWCITILFTLRIFTFIVTIVPPSTINCINRNSSSPYEWNVVKYLLLSDDNTCIDYMFSGHACYFVLLFLFTMKMSESKIEKILCANYAILGIFSIVAGHIHYTADVIVGIVLSIFSYYFVPISLF